MRRHHSALVFKQAKRVMLDQLACRDLKVPRNSTISVASAVMISESAAELAWLPDSEGRLPVSLATALTIVCERSAW